MTDKSTWTLKTYPLGTEFVVYWVSMVEKRNQSRQYFFKARIRFDLENENVQDSFCTQLNNFRGVFLLFH